ncbi:MAG: ATP-binding protein [Candidatus Krumholzibacteriia bacterium]
MDQRSVQPSLAAVLLVSLALLAAVAPPAALAGDILIIHSYHQGYGWTDDVNAGMVSALVQGGAVQEIHTEYMDTKRFPPEDSAATLVWLYAKRYHDHPVDVILCSDDNAFNFLLNHAEDILPGVPVVFCGTNYLQPERLDGHPNWVGVSETVDLAANLALIPTVWPRTRTVHVLVDDTTTGRRVRAQFDEVLSHGASDLDLVFHTGETADELDAVAAGWGPDEVVLLTVYFRDRFGRSYDANAVLSRLAPRLKTPVFGTWDFNLGHGIIGGKLTSGRFQGESAGRLARRILDGEDPATLPRIQTSPNRLMFDHTQLQRLGIGDRVLPADSIIVNAPPSFFALYRNALFGGAAAIAALACIVIVLVLNLRHRRREEALLRTTSDALEQRVIARTRELMAANDQLAVEVEAQARLAAELQNANAVLASTNAELTRSRQRLVTSEKLASVGTLAGGVAHEINNPLGFVRSNHNALAADLAVLKDALERHRALAAAEPARRAALAADLERFEAEHELTDILDDLDDVMDETRQGLERVQGIVESLQIFSQIDDATVVDVDLNACLERALTVISTEVKERCEVSTDFAELPVIRGNQGSLVRAFANLVVNATQAIEAGGRIQLSTRRDGDQIEVTIGDTGRGIASEHLDRIFDPFFTTRGVGKGTGMGLAVVHGVLEKHDAAIDVESEVGRGTTFRLRFRAPAGVGEPV